MTFSITLLYTTYTKSKVKYPDGTNFVEVVILSALVRPTRAMVQKLQHIPQRLTVMECLTTRSVDVSLSHQPKDITTAVLSRALSSITWKPGHGDPVISKHRESLQLDIGAIHLPSASRLTVDRQPVTPTDPVTQASSTPRSCHIMNFFFVIRSMVHRADWRPPFLLPLIISS